MGEHGPAFRLSWLRGLFAFEDGAPVASSYGPSLPGTWDDEPGAWGFWATLLWTLAIVAACGFVTVFAFLKWSSAFPRLELGLKYALPIVRLQILTAVAIIPQVVGFYVVARLVSGSGLRYLGLRWPPPRYLVYGIGIAVTALVLREAVILMAGGPFLTPAFGQAYRSVQASHLTAVYWICIAIIGPAGEEITFRGFLFRGWSGSRLGTLGTIVLTAAIWAAIHWPNSFLHLLWVFALGLVLGWLRWRSGSVLPTIAAHVVTNTIGLTAAAVATSSRM